MKRFGIHRTWRYNTSKETSTVGSVELISLDLASRWNVGVAIVEANEREFSSITVVRMLLVLVIKRIVSLVRVSKY